MADPSAGSAGTAEATDVGLMAGVAATPSGFVAVGYMGDHGYAWRSSDGLTWSERYQLPGAEPLTVSELVNGAGGLVAVGGDFEADSWHTVTWFSVDDGRTWSESPFPVEDVDAVTASSDAYWAFGSDPGPDGQGGLAPHGVFRSSDGSHWDLVGTVPPGPVRAAVAIPTSTGDLLMVAMADDSAVYSSSDGKTWTRESGAGSSRSPVTLAALVATDGAILAVGGIADRPAAWIALPVASAAPAGPPPPNDKPVACPIATVDVAAIMTLSPRERLRCFGSRTLTFTAFSAEPDALGGACDCTASPGWLTGGGLRFPALWLSPLEAPFGRTMTLSGFVRPSVKGTHSTARWVTVTGHFDDPASTTCRVRNLKGGLREPAATTILACRESFAVTSIGPASPPDPTTALRIASPWAVEPSDGGIDHVPPEVRVVGMAEVWRDGGPVASVLVFRTALAPAATKAFGNRIVRDSGGVYGRPESGVAVAVAPASGIWIFSLGHLTFMISGAGTSVPSAATLRTIVAELIRANR